MNTLARITLFLVLLITVSINGQDKLLLLNGRVDRGKVLEETEGRLKFQVYKNGGATKLIEYEKYRLFSWTNIEGQEKVFYQKDTLIGNFFSENQMRMYIYGERDAYANYQSSQHFLVGYTIGLSVSLFDTYAFKEGVCANGMPVAPGFFKRTPSIGPILVPFGVTIGAGLFKSKIKKEDVSDVTFLANEQYLEGFNRVKRFKKIRNYLLGSMAGVATGLIGYYASGGPCN